MSRFSGRRSAVLVVALLGVTCGCRLFKGEERQLPLPPNTTPEQVIDAAKPDESVTPLDPNDLAETGRVMLHVRQTAELDKRSKTYNVLALSGGSVYGAYSAGVLCGWSASGLTPEQGGRPEFDVVTGISTGALIAPFAFLGPKYDELLRKEYTTTTTKDVYTRRNSLRGIIAESIVDNAPLRDRVYATITDCIVAELAAAHAQNRRLYIGTTNADTKRIVLWDIGGIATKGGPDARKLIADVMIASASIPAFFPPVRINVAIDGRPYEELHIDGSVTRSLFFRPPMVKPREKGGVGADDLVGSNLYVLVAGKINPAPAAVRTRTFALALDASNTLLYSLTRGDLYRMYDYCLLTGMNLRVAAIPDDEEVPKSGTEFVPEEMTKLFNAGYRYGQRGDVTEGLKIKTPKGELVTVQVPREGTAWRDVPPGLKAGEKQGARTGRELKLREREPGEGAPRGPDSSRNLGPTAPPIPGGS